MKEQETQDCIALGFKRHTYHGKPRCVLCGHRRRVNAIGEPCLKCSTLLTERNTSELRGELRCNHCYAERQRKRRKKAGKSYFVVFIRNLNTRKSS